ncbi:MAG: 4-hydroxy-2-oxovalerate aldolase, partial [Acidobacteriota bacterium]
MSAAAPRAPALLECTLRDGSYAVDFQFSPQDTALVARVLEEAGVAMVEVGHGLGLGASLAGKGRAAASDAAYMEAAAGALERARWGMFCIPGIARLSDLELAASLGMGFVRVGVNPSGVSGAAPFLARAAELGLTAFANVMKSYILTPVELAAKARELAGYGAAGVYVVDSAGCMLPEAVAEAVRAVAAET